MKLQANAGSNSGPTHMHHASGSSEDSSAEDMPLRTSLPMTSTNGGSGPHHIGTNFQKQGFRVDSLSKINASGFQHLLNSIKNR